MRCDECRFWLADFTDPAKIEDDIECGTCQRYPPQLVHRGPSEPLFCSCLPDTCPNDWCGEFQPSATASVSREQADLEQAVEEAAKENPGAFDEVVFRMAAGEPLHDIQADLDNQDNQ